MQVAREDLPELPGKEQVQVPTVVALLLVLLKVCSSHLQLALHQLAAACSLAQEVSPNHLPPAKYEFAIAIRRCYYLHCAVIQ